MAQEKKAFTKFAISISYVKWSMQDCILSCIRATNIWDKVFKNRPSKIF